MKVAARKTAQGYIVSEKRCEMCEMPLLSMNGIATCKVCPAIEKWTQKKSEYNVSNDNDAVRYNVATEKEPEAFANELDDKCDKTAVLDEYPNSVKRESVETGKGTDGKEDKASEVTSALDNQHFVQDDRDQIDATSERDVNDFVYERNEVTESSARSIEVEGIEMPSFRIRYVSSNNLLISFIFHS
jgi:hypothetical protein